jgi:hypothetical protein
MTAMNRYDNRDAEVATEEYEKLRANALGEINRAPKLTLFLRDGMSSWLRALGNHACTKWATPPNRSEAFGELGADMPGTGLASILTDAILAAGTVACLGGSR